MSMYYILQKHPQGGARRTEFRGMSLRVVRRHFGSRGGLSRPRLALAWTPQGTFSCFLLSYCVSPEVRMEYLSYVITCWSSGVYSSRTSIHFAVVLFGTARPYAQRRACRFWPIGKVCILPRSAAQDHNKMNRSPGRIRSTDPTGSHIRQVLHPDLW